MVTGVGGGVGQSIVKALKGSEYRIVGVDAEPLAAGLYASDAAYIGHYAVDDRFIPRLLEIAAEEECVALFPGHDVELRYVAESAHLFRAMGCEPIVSSTAVIDICDDKWATVSFLSEHGYAAPQTQILTPTTSITGPAIVKPRRGGARSQGVHLVHDDDGLTRIRHLVDPANTIVQQYIEGSEYTCGTVTLAAGCVGAIVMRRVLRDGDTYKAFVETDDSLVSTVQAMANDLGPYGACNFQLRLTDDGPCVFEINARCSGTTAARALAGFNEPLMILDAVVHQRPPTFAVKELTVLRYWNELPLSPDTVRQLAADGCLRRPGGHL
jgi:carbamoyl-phosphate synthase large subunit